MSKKRRKNKKRSGGAFWIALAAAALVIALGFIWLGRRDKAAPPTATPEPSAAPTNLAIDATPLPTPSYIPTPSPEPTQEPIVGPDVLSFYTPETIYYSPRVGLDAEFLSPMKRGEDIGSFVPIPSTVARLENEIFPELIGRASCRGRV